MTVRYRAGDSDDVFEFDIADGITWDNEALAEMAAEDYFDCHDGWESKWPLAFTLLDKLGAVIEHFVVHREDVPSFTAHARPERTEG